MPSQMAPRDAQDVNKRRLLLVYIHGFNGSEDSFHNFPAHVHDVLAGLLSESHVVYSRVYPQYKTRGELQAAVDNFSSWISPFEANDLDIILLGHSLGGIVASDTALLSAPGRPLKHRILGLVNFDVPFLGVNTGILRSGVGGLFNQSDVDQRAAEEDMTILDAAFQNIAINPDFSPPLASDERDGGRSRGALHQYLHNKHKRYASPSMIDTVKSYYKFAGCLNRPAELRERYRRLMEVEPAEYGRRRMRFVNYYTETSGGSQSKTIKLGTKTFPIQATTSSDTLSFPYRRTATTDPNMGLLASGKQKLKQAASDSSLLAHWSNIKSKQSSQSSVEVNHTTSEPNSSAADLRKLFVMLPSENGGNDSLWIPVSMKDMDSVTAHQSMFFAKEAGYDRLVGDTVSQIEKWIQDDLSQEALLQMA